MRRGPLSTPLLLAIAGCAAAPAPPPRAQERRAEEAPPVVVSPARWSYHPAAPSTALAAAKVESGGCVFTAEGGQRWSTASTKMAGGRLVCAGKAEASGEIAPEDLSSAIRRADGSWIFVGTSGALFEAADALGPFKRSVPSPEPLARVAGAGAGVLATTLDGRLLRWEEASGWKPAVTSGPLTGARVFDVAVGDEGRALVLAFPEALFRSEDGGATWSPAGTPTVGARALGRTGSGSLGAQGLFETLVWKTGRPATFERGKERVHQQQAALDVEVGRAASGAAVQAGRAAMDGDRYYEIVRPENDGEAWLLARGRIDGRLETAPIPDSTRCGNLRLGARGKTVYLVCVSQDEGQIAAEVRRSTDQGTTWGEGIKLVTPDTDQINVAVAPDGGALVVGLCRPLDGGGACKPDAPMRIKVEGGAASTDAGAADAGTGSGLRAVPASAPQLSGAALLPAFSPDGRSAYFLGRRGKDDRLNLFVSHDGGETFSPRALEAGGASPRPARSDEDDTPAEPEAPDTFELDDAASLRPGDDGTLGLLLMRTRGDWAYVLADDDGRVLQVSSAPSDPSDEEGHGIPMIMSGHGRRVIALPVAMPDDGPLVWESLDGGATWDRQGGPQSLSREYEKGTPTLVCGLGGCLMGDTVARVGWGGSGGGADAGQRPPDAAPAGGPSVQTPIVCELAKTPWARIENAYGGMTYGVPIPGIHEAMRGRAVWSVLTVDRRTGAVGATSAALPESGEGEARIVTRQMLGPRAGGHLATAISATQHEGFAAVRVAVPVDAKTGKPKPGGPMRDVEVAWENYFEGTSGRARIADAGPIEANDVSVGDAKARGRRDEEHPLMDALHAALISITSRGVFVHPHARVKGTPAFFIDAAGRAERFEDPTWPSTTATTGSLEIRSDAAAAGGALFGVGLVNDREGAWGTIALARSGGGVTALSLLPPVALTAPLSGYTTWAWTAKAPVGVSALAVDPARGKAWAHFVGFRGDGTFGPVEQVPTLFDLGDRPRGCTAADRASTPRTMAPLFVGERPLFPGARHPVIVREPKAKGPVTVDEPIVLVTSGAVLHGTPASPCVAAWEAPAVGRNAAAALLPGDLAHAWMFRFSYDVPKSKRAEGTDPVPSLEYRAMACRFDPAAHVPDPVWNEPGLSKP